MQSTFGCGLLLCLLAVAFAAVATEARHPLVPTPLAFQRVAITNQGLTHRILSTRGGDDATLAESDDEEEEEEDKPVSKLASSAVKSTEKTRSKQTAKVKAAVSEGLSQKKQTAVQKKKKRKGLRLPYIIGACMNPFTLIAMTKAYWASLFNLDYIRKVCASCGKRFQFHFTVH